MRSSAPSAPAGTAQLDVAAGLLALLRDTTTEPRPDIQLEALTLAVAADLPVLLWGEPGIGKTAALTQLAASLDLPLTTVIASVHEPSRRTSRSTATRTAMGWSGPRALSSQRPRGCRREGSSGLLRGYPHL